MLESERLTLYNSEVFGSLYFNAPKAFELTGLTAQKSAYCNTGLKPPQPIFPTLIVGYTADLFVKNVNDMLFNQQVLFMGIVIRVLYTSHYFPFIYTFL